jgi:hypothetical protein
MKIIVRDFRIQMKMMNILMIKILKFKESLKLNLCLINHISKDLILMLTLSLISKDLKEVVLYFQINLVLNLLDKVEMEDQCIQRAQTQVCREWMLMMMERRI